MQPAVLLPLVRPRPEPAPFPEAGPFPEVGPFPEAAESAPSVERTPSERDAASRPGSAAGSARWHLSGLRPGLGRKSDRSPGPALPSAEAPPQATPVWWQPPAPSPKPRARWMLRAQPRGAAPVIDQPAPAEPPPVVPEPEATAPELQATAPEPEATAPELQAPEPEPEAPALVAARFVGVERERPLPSIERALSGPGSRGEVSWRRQVKVVAGGQGPGKRDQETLDRDRVRLPLAGPRRIVVLGCTRGGGQTVTTLMTSHILAAVREVPVAALDLNPGATSLAARHAPAASVKALLAGQQPDQASGPAARLDVIADLPGHGPGNGPGHGPGNGPGHGPGNSPGNGTAHALEGDDFRRLADLLAERYPLTLIDPAPSGLTRVLAAADQLVLVAPASPDAATSLANTQQWLGAHGHGELAARAVTVINGVSRRTMEDVLRAESVARGRCRAIVRVPWDDLLSARPGASPAPHPQTRLAYTALAGVLVAGMAAAAAGLVPGRNPGEHSD